MALLLPPFRPSQFVGANLANPLARGLAAFYCYNSNGSWWNAVNGKIGTTGSGQSALATSEGRVLQYNGSARVAYTNAVNPNAVSGQLVTVIARLKLVSKPGNKCAAAAYSDAGGSRGSWAGFDSNGFAMAGQFTSNGMMGFADSTDHTGEWVTVAGSNDSPTSTGGGFSLWVNGKYIGHSASGSTSASAASQVNLGRDPTNYYSNFTGQIAWVAAYNRILSDAEHLAIHRDPYSLIGAVPNRRRTYAVAGGGGGSFKPGLALNATRLIGGGMFQ